MKRQHQYSILRGFRHRFYAHEFPEMLSRLGFSDKVAALLVFYARNEGL